MTLLMAAPIIKKTVVPAGGMRRGMLSNMHDATEALNKLLELAEKDFSRTFGMWLSVSLDLTSPVK